jgi:PiT family inorganic phosphate transporter
MIMARGQGIGHGVNWEQAREVGLSLLVSPILGFCCAALLLLLARAVIKRPELFKPPAEGKAPPLWIRCVLFLTCTGVSFAHGSNDGQKGMGLIMLILIGILPGTYSLNLSADARDVDRLLGASRHVSAAFDRHAAGPHMESDEARAEIASFLRTRSSSGRTAAAVVALNTRLAAVLAGKHGYHQVPPIDRRTLRSDVYLIAETIATLDKTRDSGFAAEMESLRTRRAEMLAVTRFIPVWVKIAVACALGIGTMIGWKRIVVTVGEKIGKQHLTYAQGAAAEMVAMGTIGASDYLGLPVSTTHVLSSGVAGTMAANHSGLQMKTLRNLLLAWVLTLPVCALLGALTFAFGLYIVLNVLGIK